MFLPILAGCIVLFVVVLIVSRSESSSFVHLIQWISSNIEGFAVAGLDSDIPRCPKNYSFFNDARGDSFCCQGSPDVVKHTCSSSFCSMSPNKKDPRTSKPVPLCADIVRQEQARLERTHCPASLPNHAGVGKCCKNPSNPTSGDCYPTDNSDTRAYCITEGGLKNGETRCISLRLMEESTCPDGFQKSNMPLVGDVYGPVCHNLQKRGFCYPENTIDEVQRQGYWKKKNKHTWIEACGVWKKVNEERDTTIKVDMTGPS